MLYRHSYRDLVWVDSELATEEEARELGQEFGLPDPLVREIVAKNFKPVFKALPDHLYLALHFPALKHTHSESRKQEIDFILGRNFLITNHYDTVDSLHKFSKTFEVETVTNPDDTALDSAADIFFAILKKLYRSVIHELAYQSDELFEIESSIFEGREREMVSRLSKESLNLLIIEQVLSSHKDVLAELGSGLERFLGEDFKQRLQVIQDEHERVADKARLNRGLVDELRLTNDALLQTKQNEIAKNLTVIATMTLPLAIIASILGANFKDMPLINHPNGFAIMLAVMFLTSATAFIVFKYKRWL